MTTQPTTSAARPSGAHRAAAPSGRGPRDNALRADLEGLRAVAVLGVVVYHLHTGWLPGGFAGVDVFFVLSGFFITGLLLREAARSRTVDLVAFWGRRARRLLPAAAVVLIGTVTAGMLFVDAIDARRFAQDGIWTALFSVNWHFAQQGTSYLADTDPSPMTHFWSLGVEEQFYLVWPVLLFALAWVVARRWPHRMSAAVAALAVAVSVPSFLLAWHLTAGLQPYAYFATYSRVWQLGLGAGLAAAATQLGRLPLALRTLARWGGLAAIVAFYALAPLDIVYPSWIAIVPTLGAGLVIVSGLPRSDERAVAGRLDPLWHGLRSTPGQVVGRYSYGWYLWHWPPLVILPLVLGHALTPLQLLATAVVTFGCAIVSYHVLEHPVRSSRALARNRGRLSLALGAAVIVASVSSASAAERRATSDLDGAHLTTASGQTVTPTPAVATAEVRKGITTHCELSETTTAEPECRYLADSGKGDVVLMGDSHASQWLPAVETAAQSKDWGLRMFSRDNCPFADVTKIIDGTPNTMCDTWRNDKINEIIKDKPSLVVVASYPPPGGPALYDRSTRATVQTSNAQAVGLYQAGMEASLKRLQDAGIATLLVEDQPRYDEDAPKCVLQHADDVSACSAPQKTAQHAPTDAAAAAAVPGVSTLDLTDVFCHDGRCYQVVGNILAYHDNNHLTAEMVDSLEPRIAAAMADAVQAAK